jgi:hypothetical protein
VTGGLDDVVKVWEYKDDQIGESILKVRNNWDGHSLGIVSVDVNTEGTSKYITWLLYYRPIYIFASLFSGCIKFTRLQHPTLGY